MLQAAADSIVVFFVEVDLKHPGEVKKRLTFQYDQRIKFSKKMDSQTVCMSVH